MVKDHLEKTCLHQYMGYFFQLAARVLLYASSHEQVSTYHSLYYTSLEQEIAQWVYHEGLIQQPIAPQNYISLPALSVNGLLWSYIMLQDTTESFKLTVQLKNFNEVLTLTCYQVIFHFTSSMCILLIFCDLHSLKWFKCNK